MRRQRVMGMRQSDIFILEHMRNDGDELVCTPRHLATNTGYSLSTLQKRLPRLRRVGLVAYHNEGTGEYRLTGLGRRYLTGSLSEREIEALERAFSVL